jgi:hypothetical protein
VGLLGLGMMVVAVLVMMAAAVLAYLNAHRVLPRRRSRLTYWIGMAVLVPAVVATFPLAPNVMQALAVIASFGWDAYAGGLRVVSKHGQLSNGDFLGVFWSAAIGVGCIVLDFFWVIPMTAWHGHFTAPPEAAGDPIEGESLADEPSRPVPH